jgi:hypothetical protein
MLGVSVSGYYDWKLRSPSARTLRHAWLAGEIAQVHKDSGGTYGTLRVTAELRYGRGIHVGKEQVHLLMRRLGIYGLPKRRLPRGARIGKPNSLDLVRRRFKADGPDRLWMTDITEHPTREGKIYCCAVIDAFSRMVVGWSIDSRQTGLLVTNALGMALNRRAPREGGRNHSLRPGGAVRVLGLQPEGHRSRPRPFRRCSRCSVRQCDGRGVLGPHAGRAAQPQKMEDKGRARHRDPRLHRDLAQHHKTPQRPTDAHANRVREPTPTTADRRLIPDCRLQETQVRSEPPSDPAWLTTAKTTNRWIQD